MPQNNEALFLHILYIFRASSVLSHLIQKFLEISCKYTDNADVVKQVRILY